MRAWLISLSLPLALACSGKSVGGNEPTQASVEASLPSWCQSTCEKLAACDGGQDVGIKSVSDCSQNCLMELTDGAQRSQACAQRIDQFKSCVDAGGCAVVRDNVCSLDDADECDDDNDVDPEPPGAAPVPGAGGSYPGPGPSPPPMVGTAGAPSSGPVPADPIVYCSRGAGSTGAGGARPPPGAAQVICETSYDDCSSGSSYYAICVSTSEGQSSCSCFVDNKLSTAFDPGGTCPSQMQLNYGCGWNIQ
ncbi:MAG TPA: hypothetical protein VJV79_29055 [Polyangiaceae bacterium]|nr:hypothetical protein [Polyangiaceae bacterium]